MLIYLVNPTSRPYTLERNDFLERIKITGGGQEVMTIPNIRNNDTLPRRRTSGEERHDSRFSDDRGGQGLTIIPNETSHPVYDINILESFYYARNNKVIERLLPFFGNFLLDSGAFTFMSNAKTKCDWDEYTEEYAEYIRSHNIERFFELDIDSIVGLKEVERLRAKLERLTNKLPIPVWHLSRGKEYFIKMCEQYPYVSIGGIVTQEIPRERYEAAFPFFIKMAHEHKAKIHALGYTGKLRKYRFDSVDSTAWLYGNRGGYLYRFNPHDGSMTKIDAPEGKRLSSSKAALHNFNEWIKYSQWAKKHL